MRRLPILAMLFALLGCHPHAIDVPAQVEAEVMAAASVRMVSDSFPCPPVLPALPVLDVAAAWDLALVYNPALREAAADVEAARGRLTQAGKYPNPKFIYEQEELGAREAPAGNVRLQVQQEVVTAGKRRLDRAIAGQGVDVAGAGMLTRRFEVLTRIRRAYYEYLAWLDAVQVNDEITAALRQGVAITRRLVEEVKNRPRTDLLRIEALLEEARSRQARN